MVMQNCRNKYLKVYIYDKVKNGGTMATGITTIGDKFQIGDWVHRTHAVDRIGVVYDVLQDSADDTLYNVKWVDGFFGSGLFEDDELKFCDYTDFCDRIKDRLGENNE